MSLGLQTAAAAAAAILLSGAGAAAAQPYYGYGELPPAPYQMEGGGYGYASGGNCGGDRFTLVGAHAGVTVLGVDLGAGAGLSVPTGGYCGGQAEAFEPRPYAPPPPAPMAYGPPVQSYEPQPYAPQAYYAPPMEAYPAPCGCAMPRW